MDEVRAVELIVKTRHFIPTAFAKWRKKIESPQKTALGYPKRGCQNTGPVWVGDSEMTTLSDSTVKYCGRVRVKELNKLYQTWASWIRLGKLLTNPDSVDRVDKTHDLKRLKMHKNDTVSKMQGSGLDWQNKSILPSY